MSSSRLIFISPFHSVFLCTFTRETAAAVCGVVPIHLRGQELCERANETGGGGGLFLLAGTGSAASIDSTDTMVLK